MIKVELLECREDIKVRKNGTFTKGKAYLSKRGKDGWNMLALSNEGYWVVINEAKISYANVYHKMFKLRNELYFENNKSVDDFINLINYHMDTMDIKNNLLNSDNQRISNLIMSELRVFDEIHKNTNTFNLMKTSVQLSLAKFNRGE